jgi:phosphorylase/glycogen(starch) synthase
MSERITHPDYLFEVSWDVCKKNGGIYTTVFSKSLTCIDEIGSQNYFLIGPWHDFMSDGGKYFIEDTALFKDWRKDAAKMNLHFTIGRWNIPGHPIIILVKYLQSKQGSEIIEKYIPVSELDENFKNEVIFGLLAGMIIESFSGFYLKNSEKVIAHFHESGSGSAVLYLGQNCPQIGLVYTAHSTFLGRKAASDENETFYSHPEILTQVLQSLDIKIRNRHILEKSVIRSSHVLTTVSELASRECKKLFERYADVITPNGFEERMVPDSTALSLKHENARKILAKLAGSILQHPITENSTIIATSGRLEIHNKGLDILVEALEKVYFPKIAEQLVVFFLIAPSEKDPKIQSEIHDENHLNYKRFVPEGFLFNNEYIPLVNKFLQHNFLNLKNDSIKILLIPDCIENITSLSNISYYDLLPGFDLTVFPSYYEPWGYRPLESLAFKVPTITTSLSGFGMWIKETSPDRSKAITVIERNDDNYEQVVKTLAKKIQEFSNYEEEDFTRIRQEASYISKLVLWENLFANYKQAYSQALKIVQKNTNILAS